MSASRRQPTLQPLTKARLAALGEHGAGWLAALPSVITELEHDWSVVVERELAGGSGSYVASARAAGGEQVVIKIAVLAEGFAEQVATLQRANGAGYVRLLAADLDRHALLLEALGAPLERSGLLPEEQLRCIADTLHLAWQDPGESQPARGADKASGLLELIERLWAEQQPSASEAVRDQALRFAEQLTVVSERELVIVHGDPHTGNLLAVPPRPGAPDGWCFVDPDGFVADRAYDLGVALRDWNWLLTDYGARATAERYCGILAEHTGVDPVRIWRWGFVERVSTGLYLGHIGSPKAGLPFLGSAERLV
jgi:streptomycin 6-kinase